MNKLQRIAAFSCVGVLLSASVLTGKETLKMQVSPLVARAPAAVTVRVTFQATADDRSLQVIAESQTFYRSSQVELNDRSSPLQVFEFRDLPAGFYTITGVVMGREGRRASVLRLAKIEPSVGSQ